MIIDAVVILLAYLCGSIASAIVVCRLMGLQDPRTVGSKNPGATNVLRFHGKKAALLTLCGDVIKGVAPVLLARALALPDLTVALTALAAFAGHLYPVYFGFRGGKGVATLIGVLAATYWITGTVFIATWLLMALITRISSLSALTACLVTPLVSWFLLPAPYFLTQSLMVALVFWRHRSNIKNILDGTEDRIGEKP